MHRGTFDVVASGTGRSRLREMPMNDWEVFLLDTPEAIAQEDEVPELYPNLYADGEVIDTYAFMLI